MPYSLSNIGRFHLFFGETRMGLLWWKPRRITLAMSGMLIAEIFLLSSGMAAEVSPVGPRTQPFRAENYAQVLYISQTTGSDEHGMGSSTQPWQTVQHALNQAQSAAKDRPVAILVAAGRYEVNELLLKEYVDIFGGFEPQQWRRDIILNATILDGRQQGRVLRGADHCRIDGFVVMGGGVRDKGGALLCSATSPTISNNYFIGNETREPEDWNPVHIHELANDGGAICCFQRAKPEIVNNVFADNQTETGRGGAISMYDHSGGVVTGNVFLNNVTGTLDRHRSSDGGALSVFNWSNPLIEHNVFIENKSLTRNDGGAVFVALWSSPVIRGNVFTGNRCTDDGGALFVGGQEHRYGTPKDTLPARDQFLIEVSNNVFAGNENATRNSGAMRLTMEARVNLKNNLLADDARLYIQDSNVDLVNNTILEDVKFEEMAEKASENNIVNNIFWANIATEDQLPNSHSNSKLGIPGVANLSSDPLFSQDELTIAVTSAQYSPAEHTTTVTFNSANLPPGEFTNRIVRLEGSWTVVASNTANSLCLWGDVSDCQRLRILSTYQLRSGSPCIDQGANEYAPRRDLYGDPRPFGRTVDIGADEFIP